MRRRTGRASSPEDLTAKGRQPSKGIPGGNKRKREEKSALTAPLSMERR
jgi:hypothetical protein